MRLPLLAAAAGIVLGPLVALWAFLQSPCGPDSTVDTCVLATPHATAVLLPLFAGPALGILTVAVAYLLRRRPEGRRAVTACVAAIAVVLVTPLVIVAVAPTSYPNEFVPRD